MPYFISAFFSSVATASITDLSGRAGRRALLAAIATAAALTTTSSIAAPRYDGMWSVLIHTEKGDCDPGYRYPVRIQNGSLEDAGSAGISISGKVGSTGAITVTVSAAGKSAKGSGHLAGNSGVGSWTGGSCSGSWTAERRGA